jgi:hypothetical protein
MSEITTPQLPQQLARAYGSFNDHGIDVSKLSAIELATFNPDLYKAKIETFVQDETLPYEAE